MRALAVLVAVLVALAIVAAACIGPAPLAEPPPLRPPAPWTPGAGTPTSVQKWAAAMQPAPVVEFFRGLFSRAGVRVTDTGEAFTAIHTGDRILFSDELDPESVDFVVEIESGQVDRLLGSMSGGELDAAAKFRIMAAVSTPATRAMLARPVIRSEALRSFLYWVGNAEERMHVELLAPPGETNVAHTIVRTESGTTVVPGLQGAVSEVYRLTVDDAIDFQRRMLAARSENSLWTWFEFARWYGAFTERVVVVAKAAK